MPGSGAGSCTSQPLILRSRLFENTLCRQPPRCYRPRSTVLEVTQRSPTDTQSEAAPSPGMTWQVRQRVTCLTNEREIPFQSSTRPPCRRSRASPSRVTVPIAFTTRFCLWSSSGRLPSSPPGSSAPGPHCGRCVVVEAHGPPKFGCKRARIVHRVEHEKCTAQGHATIALPPLACWAAS
jgi:hypothetical protein